MAKVYSEGFVESVIRASDCSLLVTGSGIRCSACVKYRLTLNSLLHKQKKQDDKTSPSHCTNFRFLNTPQRAKRMRKLKSSVRNTQARVSRLQRKLTESVAMRGTMVDGEMSHDLASIMEANQDHVSSKYAEGLYNNYAFAFFDIILLGSFQRIFWDQQRSAAARRSSRGMRWDPAMIRWCIYLRHLSGSAYELIRQSGVVSLPSQRTLRDYTYYTAASHGFSSASIPFYMFA